MTDATRKDKDAKSSGKAMTRNTRALWQLSRGQRGRFLAALVALAAGTLLMYAAPQIVRIAIDGILDNKAHELPGWAARLLVVIDAAAHPHRALLLAGAAIVLVTTIGGVFMYLKGRWAAVASETIIRSLRTRLYDHLQHLPASYHDKAPTGDQVQRCTSDVDTVRMLFANQAVEIARAVMLLFIGLPLMFWMDRVLALYAIALLPVIVLFSIVFFGRVRGSFKKMDDAEGAMTATLQENLTGIRVVRAFARQEYESQRFGERNRIHRDLNMKLFRIMALYWASSDFMAFAQGATVLFGGAWRVYRGEISVGTLVAFLSYMHLYLWPVRQMGRVLTELGKATVSMGRIQEILDAPRETDAASDGRMTPPHRISGEIRIENVSLWHAEHRVLDDITLHVPAGRTLAIVGPSGSGKSTLMQLLLRLIDYEHGRIMLDGMEIRELPRTYVRGQFGVVMQEPFLYSKTLRDNIRLGRHGAPDPEIVESARIACMHDSIEQFENKYDTLVGERGVTLSGGQRQRVAIARAILKDAPVLILDDALSAVDTHTETMILGALKRRAGRHTTIVIAHRLSTLMHADQIAVLEHGKLTQLGTHAELIEQDGLYRRLWQIQTALEEDLSRELADQLPRGERVAALTPLSRYPGTGQG
ncbi:ABC transporter ATP-binding protein [Fontivita pretiosa]|uniref:ABC transporter ATP-binding protein n=1 Tax=Fontivita pretiosa TaxID=2989684 RepID=UPI003D182220